MIHPAPSVTTDMADDPTGCGSGAPRGEKIRYRRGSGDLRSRERGQVRTRGGAKGRFIRHAGLQAPAVLALAVAMVLTPFRGLLVAAVGVAALQAKGFLTATGAAVTLAPVTTPAEVKHHTTGRKVTYTPTKDCGAGNRHRFREGALDNRHRSWQDNSRKLELRSLIGVTNEKPRLGKQPGSPFLPPGLILPNPAVLRLPNAPGPMLLSNS